MVCMLYICGEGYIYLPHTLYHGSYNIYYTAQVDYISGSVSGIAFLNFESMRLVLCVAAAF